MLCAWEFFSDLCSDCHDTGDRGLVSSSADTVQLVQCNGGVCVHVRVSGTKRVPTGQGVCGSWPTGWYEPCKAVLDTSLNRPALFLQSTVPASVPITIDSALGASQGFKFTELAGYLTKQVAGSGEPQL